MPSPAPSQATVDLPDATRAVSEQEPRLLLAMCIFGEARGESDLTRRAVAQVILNRVNHPRSAFGSRSSASFEDNLRAVILQPQQFSCMNPFDPNYAQLLDPLSHESPQAWARCLRCAEQALAASDRSDTLTMNSDHYFDDSILPPAWASPAKKTVKIGSLNFYRLYLPRPTGNAIPAGRGRTPQAVAPAPDLAAAEPQKSLRRSSGSLPPAKISPARRGDSQAPGPHSPRPNTSLPAPSSLRANQSGGQELYPRYNRSRELSRLLASGERRVASSQEAIANSQEPNSQEPIARSQKANHLHSLFAIRHSLLATRLFASHHPSGRHLS